MKNTKMEINILLKLFESNTYLFLFVIPFLSQLGVPIWAMFFILYAWAITNNLYDWLILFLIILFSTLLWDIIWYFIWKRLWKTNIFKKYSNKWDLWKLYFRTQRFLSKRWTLSIFLSRFLVTWIWPTLNYIIWFQSFKFRKFFSNVVFWEILYAGELLILWYIFKDSFEYVFNIISDFWLIVLLIFFLYRIWKRLFKKKKLKNIEI